MVIKLIGNVPSLKNSKIKTSKGIFSSKTVKKYLYSLGIQRYSAKNKIVVTYKNRENEFEKLRKDFDEMIKNKNYPLKIGFHFIRNSKRSFDFNNANQIIADLLVAHNFIEDDSMDYFLPFPLKIEGNYYSYNKEEPGVIIKIL